MSEFEHLIACPRCDALYRAARPKTGERAVCHRCHSVLIAPRVGASVRMVALSISVSILLIGALFLPFLHIERLGLGNSSSVFDVALIFAHGIGLPLVLAVASLIIVIPLLRALLVIYAVAPVVLNRNVRPHAARAFRWSETLRPWAMAEIFVLGCAIALVKIVDLATVDFGPAFWMFSALVLINVFQDSFLCKWTVWSSLEQTT